MPPQPEGLTASLRFPAAAHWLKSDNGLVARHHVNTYTQADHSLRKRKDYWLSHLSSPASRIVSRFTLAGQGKWQDETRRRFRWAVLSRARRPNANARLLLSAACIRRCREEVRALIEFELPFDLKFQAVEEKRLWCTRTRVDEWRWWGGPGGNASAAPCYYLPS